MTSSFEVPICVCHHPLDAHDVKSNQCIMFSCPCTGFTDSGKRQKVVRGIEAK